MPSSYDRWMALTWFERLCDLDGAIERGDWMRAGGECLCEICGKMYYDHRSYDHVLNLLCNGELVKL